MEKLSAYLIIKPMYGFTWSKSFKGRPRLRATKINWKGKFSKLTLGMRCVLLARETEPFPKNALWTSVVQARQSVSMT